MKWLPVAAWLAFLCLFSSVPVSATTAHAHKTTRRKAKTVHAHSTRRSHTPVHHPSTVSRSPEKAHAGLQHASYRPGPEPQSSSSSSSQTHKSSTYASSKRKTTTKRRHGARREPTQMAPTADRISEIQSALARGGYYKSDPSGKWDADTVDALQRFQSANGLDSTGKLDALTLQKLGLGSDVAGYSAPKGIVEHSCCSMTPSPSFATTTSQASNSPSSSAGSPARADPPPAQGASAAASAAGAGANQPSSSH
jgi:hypothetical protein